MLTPLLDDADLFARLSQYREHEPVRYDASRNCWQVFRYQDVRRVLTEHQTFSSANTISDSSPLRGTVLTTDPPRHKALRDVVNQSFTVRHVQALEPRIRAIVNELLGTLRPGEPVDFVQAFTAPLPVIVIAELLGIPIEKRAQFKIWSDGIVASDRVLGREMIAYFDDLIEQRRQQEAGEDLISRLLCAEVDGFRLSAAELHSFCVLLLVAGNETTTNLLGNGLLTLLEQPARAEWVSQDTGRLLPAIEEMIRYRSPIQIIARRTTVPVCLGEVHIEEGQIILAYLGAANRDTAVFPHAETVDLARSPNQHLAFGQGIHFCLGAPLARLEARIAFEALLPHIGLMRVQANQPIERISSEIVFGPQALPIVEIR